MSATTSLPPQVSPPEFAVTAARPHALRGVDVIALPVLAGDDAVMLGPGSAEVGELLGVDLLAVLDAEHATGKTGEVTTLPVPLGAPDNAELRQVLLVGLGAAGAEDFRRAGAALARAAFDRRAVATTIPTVEPALGLEQFVVGATLGSFAFAWRKDRPEHVPVARMVLAGLSDADRPALERAVAMGGASWRARTLASVPSNLKSPAWLADQAVALAEEAGLGVEVWDEQRLADVGFGGVLGVGQASATPPRLIRLDYTPARAGRRTPTVVLVGKGITFDTGGLTLKPHEALVNMKRDMTGGAVVMSVLAALSAVGCPVKVVGLIPAAENALGGNALRPGDVVTHYGGRTTEVTNTDAEGRLVLADAMAWAVEQLEARGAGRRGHADRCHEGGAGTAGRRCVRHRRRPRRGPARVGQPGGRATVAVPPHLGVRGEAQVQGGRRRQRPGRARRDHRSAVPPALRRRLALGAPRHRLGRRRARRQLRVHQGADRLRGPAAARLARFGRPAGRDRLLTVAM